MGVNQSPLSKEEALGCAEGMARALSRATDGEWTHEAVDGAQVGWTARVWGPGRRVEVTWSPVTHGKDVGVRIHMGTPAVASVAAKDPSCVEAYRRAMVKADAFVHAVAETARLLPTTKVTT